jgi:hypothetical protein
VHRCMARGVLCTTREGHFSRTGVQDLDAALVDESLLEDEDPLRFQQAREGDHLLCPFQCDQCHFLNMKKRDYILLNIYDLLVMICIRWAILDSLWAREREIYGQFKSPRRCTIPWDLHQLGIGG